MKLGVLTVLLGNKGIEEVLQYLKEREVEVVELGTGGFPGNDHANPDILLNEANKLQEFKDLFEKYEMEISAFSCHGNPVHPQKDIADSYHQDFKKTVLLAEKMGIDRVITFSGCPGGSSEAKHPNWITCPWPEEYSEMLEYQWNDVLIPYWEKASTFAKEHGVDKICLEMHPGFCVYNPETMLKLREAVGEVMGVNFDPSHLIWQGIDINQSIRDLGDAIYHVHAKDTKVDEINKAKNGMLDTKHYSNEINRSWVFRSVGYGNGYNYWKDIVSNLRMIGYDDVLSIEHEDSLMSATEGLDKAISFLKDVLITEKTGEMWWA